MALGALKSVVGLLFALLITGCAGVAASGFDKSNTVGRDVDEVIREIESKEFKCGKKFIDSEAITNKKFGAIVCGAKEQMTICPDSSYIKLWFDLNTKIVDSLAKERRGNCL